MSVRDGNRGNQHHGSPITRRAVMTAAGGALVAAGLGLGSTRARAQSAPHVFKVGTAEVTVFSDGAWDVPPSFVMAGRPIAEIEALFKSAGQTFTGLRSQVNVTVVKLGAEVILIDTGGGPDFMPTLGKLPERLDAAGVKPETITKVIFTHAHADHLWGVIDPLTNDTMFEKAEHLMTAAERDYWLQEDVATRLPDAFKSMGIGTQRRLKTIASRLKTMATGSEIVPGLQVVDTSGHTPGHVSVLLRSGGDQLLIGSDVLTQHVVSFAAPDWRWGPDMDPEKAIAARRRTLDHLATDRVRLLGYHLPWPGLGRVERAGTAFRFVPA